MSIIAQRETEISETKSILSFSTTGGGAWAVWDRFLQIDGKPAYHIGNICGTCAFFFERLEGATKIDDPAYSIGLLNSGLKSIDENVMLAASAILPNGKYLVLLHDIRPVLTSPNEAQDYFSHEQIRTWGVDGFGAAPHHPKTNYYRLKSGFDAPHERFFEFLIPMFPQSWLTDGRLETYKKEIAEGKKPTVLTLSVLDHKEMYEADVDGVWSHVCLAHYIVDGHHKAFAASLMSQPITALSFVALDYGITAKEEAVPYVTNICDREA